MGGAVVSLLVVAFVSYVVIRAGGKALELTGLSHEASHFQALSAYFGAGFTTGESEMVVNHPVRRRIIRDLIVVGNIGVTTLVATVVVGLVQAGGESRATVVRFIVIAVAGLGVLFVLSRTRFFVAALDRLIAVTLRRVGVERAMDYERMLRVQSGFSVAEVGVDEGDWMAGQTLGELQLRKEGVNVLGVARSDGSFVGTPRGHTQVNVGDTLIVYAHEGVMQRLAARKRGAAGEGERARAVEAASEREASEGEGRSR